MNEFNETEKLTDIPGVQFGLYPTVRKWVYIELIEANDTITNLCVEDAVKLRDWLNSTLPKEYVLNEMDFNVLQQRYNDLLKDYHRWHDAFMDLKYPGSTSRLPVDPDVIPITEQPERYVEYYRTILKQISEGWDRPETLAKITLNNQIRHSEILKEEPENA